MQIFVSIQLFEGEVLARARTFQFAFATIFGDRGLLRNSKKDCLCEELAGKLNEMKLVEDQEQKWECEGQSDEGSGICREGVRKTTQLNVAEGRDKKEQKTEEREGLLCRDCVRKEPTRAEEDPNGEQDRGLFSGEILWLTFDN